MNWAIPCAPAGETANGLKFDSAISCAASRAAGTFQRDEARISGPRNRAGTKAGSDAALAGPSPPTVVDRCEPTRSPAAEQGAGPATKP